MKEHDEKLETSDVGNNAEAIWLEIMGDQVPADVLNRASQYGYETIEKAIVVYAKAKIDRNMMQTLVDYVKNNTIKIMVDYECNAEKWWEAARQSADNQLAPKEIRDWVNSFDDEIYVDKRVLKEIIDWASSLPEWDEGPVHARYPLLIQDVK